MTCFDQAGFCARWRGKERVEDTSADPAGQKAAGEEQVETKALVKKTESQAKQRDPHEKDGGATDAPLVCKGPGQDAAFVAMRLAMLQLFQSTPWIKLEAFFLRTSSLFPFFRTQAVTGEDCTGRFVGDAVMHLVTCMTPACPCLWPICCQIPQVRFMMSCCFMGFPSHRCSRCEATVHEPKPRC